MLDEPPVHDILSPQINSYQQNPLITMDLDHLTVASKHTGPSWIELYRHCYRILTPSSQSIYDPEYPYVMYSAVDGIRCPPVGASCVEIRVHQLDDEVCAMMPSAICGLNPSQTISTLIPLETMLFSSRPQASRPAVRTLLRPQTTKGYRAVFLCATSKQSEQICTSRK